MRLSTNEIMLRASQFAASWAGVTYEKGNTQSFYDEFFAIFDVKRRQVARYEEHFKMLGNRTGFIDLFWPGTLLVEQKSGGRSLEAARVQAGDYFDAIKDSDKPRFQLLSDFATFDLLDRDTRESWSFPLADLPRHIEKFNFIRGVQTRKFVDQDPANIAASEIMGSLHDALEASGYRGHDLERYLVRLLFILFADDTGIFEPRDIFLDLITARTREDGSDTGGWLAQLFQVLDTPEDERQDTLDNDLAQFPYVNGDLFKGTLRIAAFNSAMRKKLLEAAAFNWSQVSPAIFGSLFQSVMDARERRKAGAHYTTEKNIMKVIGPLFLDDLKAEFARLAARKDGRRRAELEAYRRRLGALTFFDPACGCGNFLIIAYRELRQLELEVLKALNPQGQRELNAAILSNVDVDQFYGIEIGEFPARIAEVAMWMMDHIMNNSLSLEFGQTFVRIPLRKSACIRHGDALEMDWNHLLPATQCSYVFGNPPFIGAKYQTPAQRAQVRDIARLGGSGGTLDYVAAWFIKAGDYVGEGRGKIAFVATNSITQGEQVAQLWPILFGRCALEIAFAHRTFAWGSEARGVAHVHVVIIGLTRRDMEPWVKRLFSYDGVKADAAETEHKTLSPYLFDAASLKDRHLVVQEVSRPINGLPRLIIGSKPIDGGYLIMDDAAERERFLAAAPAAGKFLRPYIGAHEYINGGDRSILCVQDASPDQLAALPNIVDRLRKVREFRQGKIPSKRNSEAKEPGISSLALANTPGAFHVTVIPASAFLVLPEVSSERRQYAPIGWLAPPVVPSNLVRVLVDANLSEFGILTSAMHMAWLRNIGGRLKSDYRYSIGLVYNTFPWPQMTPAQEAHIGALAQAVLAARLLHPDSTLADLYDPDLMPPALRKAHHQLDLAVDRLYRKAPFASERERVEHLFAAYEAMVAPLQAAAGKKKRTAKAPG